MILTPLRRAMPERLTTGDSHLGVCFAPSSIVIFNSWMCIQQDRRFSPTPSIILLQLSSHVPGNLLIGLCIPDLHLPVLQLFHLLFPEDGLGWQTSLSVVDNRSYCVDPLLSSFHKSADWLAHARPRNASVSHRMTSTSCTTRPLVLFLAFANIAVTLEVGGVELVVEIVGYSVVLLLSYALFCELEKALFSCAIDDGLLAEFFL